MSRSKNAVELCVLLVDETYGELTSRILTLLLRRGRLPIPLLSQHTRLTPRQLRHGLAVLIQQNLVYYHFDIDTGATHYEANHDAAYALVRSGKIMEMVNARYGSLALSVVQNLLLLGHTKVSDLAEAHGPNQKPPPNGDSNGHVVINGSMPNDGTSSLHVPSDAQLDVILCDLLETGFVEPVVQSMFRSPTDTYSHVEKEILQNVYGGSTKGTKQKDELKGRIRERLQEIRSEGRDWEVQSNKRALDGGSANGINGTAKRRRLSNGSVNGRSTLHHQDKGIRIDRDMVLRVNFEKFAVALRNQRLVELVSNRIGETTSHVYAEALRLMEVAIPRCRLDPIVDDVADVPEVPSITTMELSLALSKSINIASGIGKASSDKIDTTRLDQAQKGRKRKLDELEAAVDGVASSDDEDSDENHVNGNGNISEVEDDSDRNQDDPFTDASVGKVPKRAKVTFQDKLPKLLPYEDRHNRMMQIKNHLMLLAGDECRFLRKCGIRGQGEWTVDFEELVEYLRESELDALILDNFGKTGHRLARIMRKMGKIDEKQLPSLALMKQKDVRTKLAEMQMAGMVDIQEVPRDNNRTNNRTIFLWYFDTNRVSSIVLDKAYKAMSRCLQRLEVEKRHADEVISLSERTDVRGKEEEMLTPALMNDLREIRRKEERLLGQVARLDELIGIFRDY